MSFFRYPGGKTKLRSHIIDRLKQLSKGKSLEYREPFFGGGSIGLKFITASNTEKVWINDKDIGITCLWSSLINFPQQFKKRVLEFIPSIEDFYSFKEELIGLQTMPEDEVSIVDIGFKKLAIHQISYSGLGTKSGGPLGGKNQKSQYKVDCRWSPNYICKKIDLLHNQLKKYSFRFNDCTNYDFDLLITNIESQALIYLDPPYYIKGNDLYQCGFTELDHKRLSESLKITNHEWLLSYDDCPEIRDLYQWAQIEELDVKYSITGARIKGELLISKK